MFLKHDEKEIFCSENLQKKQEDQVGEHTFHTACFTDAQP